MKEFSYKINLCIVGKEDKYNQIFLNYLNKISLSSEKEGEEEEIFLIQDDLPIKVKPFIFLNLEDLIIQFKDIKKINILICLLNLKDINSLQLFNLTNYAKFLDVFKFKGIPALVGVDLDKYSDERIIHQKGLNEFSLISKARELKFIYCFKLSDPLKELSQIYNTLFRDVLQKLKILNPNLFEKARQYALDLINQHD